MILCIFGLILEVNILKLSKKAVKSAYYKSFSVYVAIKTKSKNKSDAEDDIGLQISTIILDVKCFVIKETNTVIERIFFLLFWYNLKYCPFCSLFIKGILENN